jgi:uncharacterized Zn finger protein
MARSWSSRGDGGYGRWAPYVPVARRRANASRHAAKLAKAEGRKLAPIAIEGRQIASTFWGRAWCDHLESYSDFANRLPRGRTYVRNGSVVDLQIASGRVTALVSGSEIYRLTIQMTPLKPALWNHIKLDCAGSIASLIDLLQGRFDRGVMERLTRKVDGLFPQPNEIKMACSCPDYATMCKHVAAVLYGVGARLDHQPELLFTLRGVDHLELIGQALARENLDSALGGKRADSLEGSDLGELFGIELDSTAAPAAPRKTPQKRRARKAADPQPPEAAPAPKQAAKATRARAKPTARSKAIIVWLDTEPKKRSKGPPPAGRARLPKKAASQIAEPQPVRAKAAGTKSAKGKAAQANAKSAVTPAKKSPTPAMHSKALGAPAKAAKPRSARKARQSESAVA